MPTTDDFTRANQALQGMVDALSALDSLDDFIEHALHIVNAAFSAAGTGFFERREDGLIQLRRWIHFGTFYTSDMPLAAAIDAAQLRRLCTGFTVSNRYLCLETEAPLSPVQIDHRYPSDNDPLHGFSVNMGWPLELHVPLVVRGKHRGSLNIFRAANAAFSSEDLLLAELLGKQMALALQTQRVADQDRVLAAVREREQANRLREGELRAISAATHRCLNTMSGEQDISVFLTQVMCEIIALSGAKTAGIFSYHADSNLLQLEALVVEGQCVPIDTDSEMAVWRQQVPNNISMRWIEDIRAQDISWFDNEATPYDQPSSPRREWHRRMGHRGVAMLPLYAGGRLIGTLGQCFTDAQWPNRQRVELTRSLVQHAALALQLTSLAERAQEESRAAATLEERRRIAREIHDTLAQGLAGIILHLQAAQREPVGEGREAHVAQALVSARTHLLDARRSVHTLRSGQAAHHGLPVLVDAVLRAVFTGSGIHAALVLHGTPVALSAIEEHELMRITQEAALNTLKHAGARRFTVGLHTHSDRVLLHLVDDGCGFAPTARSEGFGLLGMAERAARIGARLTVQSAPGAATEIFVRLPRTPPHGERL